MSFLNKIKPNKPVASLEGYFMAILSESKFGKTTFVIDLIRKHYKGDMSKGLLLATEIGYKTMNDVHAIPISTFDYVDIETDDDGNEIEREDRGFIETVDELIQNKNNIPYRFIIIDTVTALERYAKPYVAVQASIKDKKNYPTYKEIPYGGGYDMIAEAIYEQIDRLKKNGFGVCIIGHQKIKGITTSDGFKYDKIMFQLEEKTMKIIEREADMIIYGDMNIGKGDGTHKVSQERKLRFRSDGNIVCGTRFRNFPETIDVDVDIFLEEFDKAVLSLYDGDSKAVEKAQKEQEVKRNEVAERAVKDERITKDDLIAEILKTVTPLSTEVKKELAKYFESILGNADFKKCEDVALLKEALKYARSLKKK